ncbi:hypothetical protein BJY01DRAFT_255712 [Aspergillus pseudoustus]|uniref:GYF domain-containing protein n=1 Tax=Aspergillus pseudoustus TaxID=1810923 RepID=A0ABR4II57_9EURO
MHVEQCKTQDQPYDSLGDWINHEVLNHNGENNEEGRRQEAPSQDSGSRDWPFCLEAAVSPFHIASHLHRIAAFSLPRSTGDDDASVGSSGSDRVDLNSRESRLSVASFSNASEGVSERLEIGLEELGDTLADMYSDHTVSPVDAGSLFEGSEEIRNGRTRDLGGADETQQTDIQADTSGQQAPAATFTSHTPVSAVGSIPTFLGLEGQQGQTAGSAGGSVPASQQRTMVMPDRMRWIYCDPQGNIQGPWTGLETHYWFKAGFFGPHLPIRKLEDPGVEPLAQLIGSHESYTLPAPAARAIRKALSTSGKIDTKYLIEYLPFLSHDGMLILHAEYEKLVKFEGKSVNVAEHLRSKLGLGPLGQACYAAALDYRLLMESILDRRVDEMHSIKAAFKILTDGHSLEMLIRSEVKDETFQVIALAALDETCPHWNNSAGTNTLHDLLGRLHRAISDINSADTDIAEIIVQNGRPRLQARIEGYK